MKLWTIQPVEWYEKLLTDKVIHSERKYLEIENNFLRSYEWMISQMEQRAGRKPKINSFPIWAWFQYNNSQNKRPDLRSSGFLPKGTKGVRIEFEKPEEKVLLSDFNLWAYVLNYWHIPDSEIEDDWFDNLLTSEGINFIDKENYSQKLKQIVEQSWDKVLDMDYYREYNSEPFESKPIQATFWTLSIDEVKKVDFFTAR